MSSRVIDTDVLVAGGGPVGLSAAILLARMQVPVLLAERRPTTCTHPKATVLNTRTMELFRLWGIEEEVRESGLPIEHSTAISWVTALDGFEIGQLDLLDGGAKLDSMLDDSPTVPAICPQDVVEPILRRCAESHELADVRFATEVVDVEADADGVTATLAPTDGEPLTVRARYLVAADGPLSSIRERLGIAVRGSGALGRLVNIYFHADLTQWVERFPSVLYWVVNPDVHGVVHSLDGERRWLLNVFLDADDGDGGASAERCGELVRAAVGVPQLDFELRSIKPWTMAAAMAERFREGRIVLAGDAAHQFPPTGGFGLNTGVQDSHNLAWKLAAILQGWAGPELLDTYEAERIPVVQTNDAQTVLNARNIIDMLFRRVPDAHGLIDAGTRGERLRAELASAIPDQREHFDFQGEALGAVYRSRAVVPDGTEPPKVANPITDYAPSAHPGARAPHAWVQADGRERSTIDIFDGRLALVPGPDGDAWARAGDAARRTLGAPLDVLRVGRELVVADTALLDLYGIDGDGAVLVRPDGHVAWRSRGAAPDPARTLTDAMAHVLARTTAADRTHDQGGRDELDASAAVRS